LNLLEGPVDWARRPAGLAGVDHVFALYIEGDSMSPWREPGDLIYVSKSRPAQIGSHVVVVLKPEKPGEQPVAYVKKLVRRTAERVELRQYNPDGIMCLAAGLVSEVLRVIEWSEVLGI
jgi:phage repressor protein C with HTH and peptisase S24 domain